MRPTLLLSVALLCATSACARSIVTIPPARCADLIPSDWLDGVPGEPLPPETAAGINALADAMLAAQQWAMAFTGQTGQLGKANGRTVDAIGIMKRCEKMVNEARGG